jgi:hypothetical protein
MYMNPEARRFVPAVGAAWERRHGPVRELRAPMPPSWIECPPDDVMAVTDQDDGGRQEPEIIDWNHSTS